MIWRRFAVGLIVLLVAAPITFIGFGMGLLVVEFVIHPTVVLVISVVTALAASWATDGLAGDGLHTDLNRTVALNLALGLVPAGLAILSAFVSQVGPGLLLLVVVWMAIAATYLAFRNRRERAPVANRLAETGVWLLGISVGTSMIVFAASLLGLTGA